MNKQIVLFSFRSQSMNKLFLSIYLQNNNVDAERLECKLSVGKEEEEQEWVNEWWMMWGGVVMIANENEQQSAGIVVDE